MTDLTAARSHRLPWRFLGLLFALTAALVGFLVVPDRATADAACALPGTWRLRVTIYTPQGPVVATPTFVFHPDHTLDSTGAPSDKGNGFWNSGDDGTISFYITHPGKPDAPIPGVVQAIHLGKVHGGHFATHAYAFTKENPGDTTFIGPVDVTTEAEKVSDTA